MTKTLDPLTHYKVSEELERLMSHLNELGKAIGQRRPTTWMGWLEQGDPVRQAGLAINDVWREDGPLDPRQTPTRPGLIAAGKDLCALAEEVNEAKSAFADIISALSRKDRRALSFREEALALDEGRREVLKRRGLGALSIKSACRKIVVVNEPVARAGFTWSSRSRSIKRVSVRQIQQWLIEHNRENAPEARALLGLDEGEVLAQIQTQAPMLRVNLVLESGRRLTRRAQLPLFLINETMLPIHNEPYPCPPTEDARLPRSDQRRDMEPFIPSLRLYRYLKPEFNRHEAGRGF